MAGIRYKGQIFSGAASFGDADHVAYDNTESGLEATDVQGALDEVSNAEGVSYDNTESGLTATDVQDALDEVSSAIQNYSDIIVNTTVPGLTVTKTGRVVTLQYANSAGLTTSGITVPEGFRPNNLLVFTGKGNRNGTDYWDQGFQLTTSGILTARSTDNNSNIAVTWANVVITYITTQ